MAASLADGRLHLPGYAVAADPILSLRCSALIPRTNEALTIPADPLAFES